MSLLPPRTASHDLAIDSRRPRSRFGSTLTWYCAHEAAERRHLRDARHRLEVSSAGTSPERAQIGQAVRARSSTSAYWKTHPRPVASGPSSVFTPSGRRGSTPERYSSVRDARPVDVGAVLEDHVDEGVAEIGEPADRLDLRRAEHRGDDRIGHLILDDVGAAVPAGIDDDLRVARDPGMASSGTRSRSTTQPRPPPPRPGAGR